MTCLTDLENRRDLANALGIPENKLTYVIHIKKIDTLYETFEIPKKNGGCRVINAPKKDLKDIQKKLAEALSEHQNIVWRKYRKTPGVSHGFEKEKSIVTNAKIHRNKKFIMNIDLEDFFDSFHFGRVKGFFEKNRNFMLSEKVAMVIAQLSCYRGTLPQGAPTSPIITNLICTILDMRLLKIAKENKLDYTRYADDLTFSTNYKNYPEIHTKIYSEISEEIERAGFRINPTKTRVQFEKSRQEVTGLTVNKKVNVKKEYFKNTRAMANQLYKTGEFTINEAQATLNQLEGRFGFINQLDWYNNRLDGKKHNFFALSGREKQYQKFLFYKYFYANSRPLIVTEGKTDIIYLKAALKNLYSEYPRLINKKEDKFEFKVSFSRKTKRLEYFLNIVRDGGSVMKNIYNLYYGKRNENYQGYAAEFERISGNRASSPVVLLFDNELTNKKKPIRDFLGYVGYEKHDDIEKFGEKCFSNISKNLFVLTMPLVDGKEEVEIEDLFTDEMLSHKIEGKKFSPKDKFDRSKYYGKEIFSQYIMKNYKQLNFEGFLPLLNILSDIVENY